MFTFSILLLPVVLAFYFLESGKKENIILLITGSLSGILVFALKEFLTLSHRVVPLSFAENFIFLFMKECLIPLAVLYAIFWVISKDSREFKIQGFFPLITSFYSIYLPYLCITSPEANTVFIIVAKPVLYLSMIISVNNGIKMISQKKGSLALAVIIITSALIIPSLAESLFLISAPGLTYIILIPISIALSALDFLKQFFSKKNA